MPLPKYFQDLYNEFGTLREFDLKEVIYEAKVQEMFMLRVLQQIESKQSITKLKKREIWRCIRESKFPIMLGILISTEGILEAMAGHIAIPTFAFLRAGIFIKMTQDGLKRGAVYVKNDKTQKQYQEVADELENLKSIISSVAELDNDSKGQRISEVFNEKDIGFT